MNNYHTVKIFNGDYVQVIEHEKTKEVTIRLMVHGVAPIGSVTLNEEGMNALRKILFQTGLDKQEQSVYNGG